MRCRHCKGTGEAPDTITLECIECQTKVKFTYNTTSELLAITEDVKCCECRQRAALSNDGGGNE